VLQPGKQRFPGKNSNLREQIEQEANLIVAHATVYGETKIRIRAFQDEEVVDHIADHNTENDLHFFHCIALFSRL
jgi:hypothetical protein